MGLRTTFSSSTSIPISGRGWPPGRAGLWSGALGRRV